MQWIVFCSTRKSDPYNPPLTAVLDFLVSLHDKGLSYTTINTARSAISAITIPVNNMTIGNLPLISRFMKGVYKGSPPTPRYQSTWDVQPVLTYISSLKPPEKLDLKILTLKLVMLMSLVTAQRGQSLHVLDIDYMKEVPDGFEFLLKEHIKQSRPSYKVPSVVLKALPTDSSLCVVTYLREYVKRTKPLRGLQTKLFISCIKPYKQVSRETISRWIRSVMEAAGIDTKVFKPHSTRAQKITPKNFVFAETKREIPSGHDRPIFPARVANQNTGFASSCPLVELAMQYAFLLIRGKS